MTFFLLRNVHFCPVAATEYIVYRYRVPGYGQVLQYCNMCVENLKVRCHVVTVRFQLFGRNLGAPPVKPVRQSGSQGQKKVLTMSTQYVFIASPGIGNSIAVACRNTLVDTQ